MGRLKEIHDAGINRSAERWCPHHAAHRGSLNVPALPAGSRVERNALTPRAGTRSKHKGKKLKAGRGTVGKTAVVGAKDLKTNKVRAKVTKKTDAKTLQKFVADGAEGATVCLHRMNLAYPVITHTH